MFGGGTTSLSEFSVVQDAELMVAVDAEERPGRGAVVRLASTVEAEWLLDLYPDALEEVDAACAHQLYVSTVDRYPWGVRSLTEDFFARLLAGFKHRCEFVEARREGRRVAGAFNFTGASTLYGRYWGAFEEHPFLHFNVCLYHPVEDCIARGRERFEPGAGGEHKLTRGFEPHLTYSAHLFLHPGLDRAVRGFLAHERAAVESGLPLWWAETGFKERV